MVFKIAVVCKICALATPVDLEIPEDVPDKSALGVLADCQACGFTLKAMIGVSDLREHFATCPARHH